MFVQETSMICMIAITLVNIFCLQYTITQSDYHENF